uniref:Uncharacterized protein n=1 Tax=Chelonoidis abingdonii TaxID=106734 RepID=A0A8C0FZI4_CHEAB
MANEEDDPIIQEIDVYLAKSLSEKLYLHLVIRAGKWELRDLGSNSSLFY